MKLFISHSHDEMELALAWKDLISSTCAGVVNVWLSSDQSPTGGITLGEEWRNAIYDGLSSASFVIAIITPKSFVKPWVTWECGISSGIDKKQNVIPIVYSMSLVQLEGPLSSYQAYHGEDIDKVKEVCERLAQIARLKPVTKHWEPALNNYQTRISSFRRPGSVSQSLLHSDEMKKLLFRLESTLEAVHVNSILNNFARNEVRRIANRLSDLEHGRFELRSEKPNSEIIEYFCEYISQLDSDSCLYYTISYKEFWDEITNGGRDFSYLTRNEIAARHGSDIKRTFFIDKHIFPNETVYSDDLLSKILLRHFEATNRSKGKIQTKIFFSDNIKESMATYKNFAVWKKGLEEILFHPIYHNNELQKVNFFYYTHSKNHNPLTNVNQKKIQECLNHFELIWQRAVPLQEKHFS